MVELHEMQQISIPRVLDIAEIELGGQSMLRDLSSQSPGGMNMRLRTIRRVKCTQRAGRASHVDAKRQALSITLLNPQCSILRMLDDVATES